MYSSKTGFVSFTKLLQLLLAFASVIVLVKGVLVLTAAQSVDQERKFKSKEFQDMPLRVHKVKNLQSEKWPNDLEIEIENVSSKPIYFINAVLAFPDDPAPNGISGILLQYGKRENLDIARIAEAEDEHLDPGKTTTLVISSVYKKGLIAKQKKAPQNLKKLEFWFDTISFGDGTGFQLDQFVNAKKKKQLMDLSKAGFITFSRVLKLLLICASSIFLINGALMLSTAQSTSGEERKFKSKEFRDMPLRVRKVKNLQSETWPNDLEIEIENISSKPIYFINAVLEFPDDPAPNGSSGIKFKFGKLENMDIARLAQAEDEHVDPGRTVVLTVSQVYRKGLMVRQQKAPHNFKKLDFWFEIISFGDGTGYEGSQFLNLKKQSVQPEGVKK